MNILYFVLLLAQSMQLVAGKADCTRIAFDVPSPFTGSNPTYKNGSFLHIEYGDWSNEEIHDCLGDAPAYNVWMVNEEHDENGQRYTVLLKTVKNLSIGYFEDYLLNIPEKYLVGSPTYHLELHREAKELDPKDTKRAVSGGFTIVMDDSKPSSSSTTSSATSSSSTSSSSSASTSTSASTTTTDPTTTSGSTATVIITHIPERTTESSTTATPNTGLTIAAKAGIGVGVAAGVLAFVAGAYLLLLLARRRRARRNIPNIYEHESYKYPGTHNGAPNSFPVRNIHKGLPREMPGSLPDKVKSNREKAPTELP
ncbi:hypothetical protein FQN49_004852 [Arthroderma sp. PD_2]|nr:hypothetical protein FQN49_004852 [Arthroderma sp. PD_2]